MLRLKVTTHANATFSAAVDDVRGTPGRPLAQGEVLAKFYDCVRPVLKHEAPARLAAAVAGLERATNLAALTSALRSVA